MTHVGEVTFSMYSGASNSVTPQLKHVMFKNRFLNFSRLGSNGELPWCSASTNSM